MPAAKSFVSKSATARAIVLLAALSVAALTAGCSQKTETPQQLLSKANLAFEKGRFVEAWPDTGASGEMDDLVEFRRCK